MSTNKIYDTYGLSMKLLGTFMSRVFNFFAVPDNIDCFSFFTFITSLLLSQEFETISAIKIPSMKFVFLWETDIIYCLHGFEIFNF